MPPLLSGLKCPEASGCFFYQNNPKGHLCTLVAREATSFQLPTCRAVLSIRCPSPTPSPIGRVQPRVDWADVQILMERGAQNQRARANSGLSLWFQVSTMTSRTSWKNPILFFFVYLIGVPGPQTLHRNRLLRQQTWGCYPSQKTRKHPKTKVNLLRLLRNMGQHEKTETRSSSREVRIRVPFFLWSISVREPSQPKKG